MRKYNTEYHRKYREEHKEHIQQYKENWYKANRARLLLKAKEYRRLYPDAVRNSKQEINFRYKLAAMTYYSINKDKPICARCRIDDIDVLTIDHINGGGTAHRRLKMEGTQTYLWLRSNNYPSGYQVLCANCNLKKRIREKC